MKFWKKRFFALLGLILGCYVMACVATNPAAPPAPLAEVPSALSLPENVAVDVGEVGSGVGGLTLGMKFFKALKGQVVDVGGEFFDAITFGFTTNELANNAVNIILNELGQLEIPINPVTRTFSAANAFIGAPVKIDFADFDFPGKPEACTGCTCPTGCDAPCPTEAPPEDLKPVCYRIWYDPFLNGEFQPIMAGYITQLRIRDNPDTPENEENPGSGSFRIRLGTGASPGVEPLVVTNVGSNYDHRNFERPLDKLTEYFLRIDEASRVPPPDATVSFVRVEQKALDEIPDPNRLQKTIQESINQPVSSDPSIISTFQYLARYRTDFDFWSGTWQDFLVFDAGTAFSVPPDLENFTAECAQLSTAIGVDENTCQDLGIDVSSVPFLDLVLPGDTRVNLPADFPPVPTF